MRNLACLAVRRLRRSDLYTFATRRRLVEHGLNSHTGALRYSTPHQVGRRLALAVINSTYPAAGDAAVDWSGPSVTDVTSNAQVRGSVTFRFCDTTVWIWKHMALMYNNLAALPLFEWCA